MSRGNVTGAQFSQETGVKGDRLMGERERERERMTTVCQVTRLQDRM